MRSSAGGNAPAGVSTATLIKRDLWANAVVIVLLVVGMRLGCINHALLTVDSIRQRGVPLLGWVANELPPAQDALEANVATLVRLIGSPPLVRVPAGARADDVGGALIDALLARWPQAVEGADR